jgi:hypothetical protein
MLMELETQVLIQLAPGSYDTLLNPLSVHELSGNVVSPPRPTDNVPVCNDTIEEMGTETGDKTSEEDDQECKAGGSSETANKKPRPG